MKTFPIAAAALLFGASAYAMVPSTEPTGVWMAKDPAMVTGTKVLDTATGADAMTPQPAAVDWLDAEPVAYADDDVKTAKLASADAAAKADVLPASSDEFAATDEEWDAIAAQKAEADREFAMIEPEPDPAAETTALDEEPVPVEAGVGGPYEGMGTAAADLNPRPAAQNYPACRPGPGDDRCIQLYEPGVGERLAAWNQPTGGFAGAADTQIAMGGPYEPADSATETERLNQQALANSANTQVAMGGPYEAADAGAVETAEAHEAAHETAMNGDGLVDSAIGETGKDEELAEV